MNLVHGVGINDSDIPISYYENGKRKIHPHYLTWSNMIKRCYGISHNTYDNCIVCDEWLTLSNFTRWFKSNHVDGWQLDKDLIIGGNLVYSPDSCAFVPPVVNTFITDSKASRGELPIGVSWKKKNKKYESQCKDPFTGKRGYIGLFSTPEEAHEAWKKKKHEFALTLCEEYPTMDERIKERLSTMYL